MSTAPLHRRVLAAAVLLSAPVGMTGCAAARPLPPGHARAASACEGQAPGPASSIRRGSVTPGQPVRGDLGRTDTVAAPRGVGEDVWVYTAAHDGPATVRIDLPRADVWFTTRILYGTLGFDQLGVANWYAGDDGTHRMTFRAQPGRCYAFHVHASGADSVSRVTEYTLQVDVGSPVRPIRVGQAVNAALGGGQSRVQANESRIYYFEDWLIEDAGSDSLRVRMQADSAGGEGTLAVGVRARDGGFAELRRVGGPRPEIVFLPEPGRRYLVRIEMHHGVMDRRYRLTVERMPRNPDQD